MIRFVFASSALAVALASLAPVLPAEVSVRSAAFAQQQAGRITLADFKKQYDQGQVIVLDVRPPEAYGLGHIRGAISTPEQGVGKRAAEWTAAGKPVVTYCS